MAARFMSASPAASEELQEPDSVELEASVKSEASEESEASSETAETVESSESEESRESASMQETASDDSDSSSGSAVSAGDAGSSKAPVSGGDPALPGTSVPPKVTVSGGDALSPVKDTGTKTYDASTGYSGLEDLLIDLQETETAQLVSLTRIEAQNEAVISILLIIVVVGLLHYIYRFLKMFF